MLENVKKCWKIHLTYITKSKNDFWKFVWKVSEGQIKKKSALILRKKSTPPHVTINQSKQGQNFFCKMSSLEIVLNFFVLTKIVFQIIRDSCLVQITNIHSLQQERNKQILNRCHATISSGTRGVVYNNMWQCTLLYFHTFLSDQTPKGKEFKI